MNELNEKNLNEILKEVLHRRRFCDINELKKTLYGLLRINLIDTKRYNIGITECNEEEMIENEIPNEIDYMLLVSFYDNETGEVFDIDLYYAKTRAGHYYITEYIMQ